MWQDGRAEDAEKILISRFGYPAAATMGMML
jgi:hypothetical protein